ncbi:MAG: PLP-dependent aminotransferase family protein [Aeromicrobium sp.]|nr:PLP-dependent aminotransferase family protein [Ilumatobacteraceae bacterium]MCW2801394.1 PLP-dependent aminotransferase family protein [Aeromicrobium sp.]
MSDQRLSHRSALMRPSALREMLSSGNPPRLSLAGGLPPTEAFPFEVLAEITAELLGGHDVRSLQYTSAEGDPVLRGQVATLVSSIHRREVPSSRVVITTGSQQGIDLVGRVLLDPDDVAIVEDPTYVGALRALAPTGARIVGIACDGDGMCTDLLEQHLAAGMRPKLAYLCANFSNPSGATLSAARRVHLAELSSRYGFVVVEDDQYGRLRFRGQHLDPIASIADDVVYLSGFSKVVAPGLRVGHLVAPEWLVRPIVLAKQAADLAASSLGQRIVSRLLDRSAWWDEHLATLRDIYATRADALCAAIDDRLVGRLRVQPPEGGMFVWAEITDPTVTASALIAASRALGLALVPGSEFSTTNTYERALRLSYSTLTPAELGDAVGLMADAFDSLTSPSR